MTVWQNATITDADVSFLGCKNKNEDKDRDVEATGWAPGLPDGAVQVLRGPAFVLLLGGAFRTSCGVCAGLGRKTW